jgi:hypothetical protein
MRRELGRLLCQPDWPMTEICGEGTTFDRPTRHGYSVKNLARQFHAKLARVRLFLRGALDTERTRELSEQMRVAGLASGSVTDLEQAPLMSSTEIK